MMMHEFEWLQWLWLWPAAAAQSLGSSNKLKYSLRLSLAASPIGERVAVHAWRLLETRRGARLTSAVLHTSR